MTYVESGKKKKKNPPSRIRTSDLWIATPLQSTALPTELSVELINTCHVVLFKESNGELAIQTILAKSLHGV